MEVYIINSPGQPCHMEVFADRAFLGLYIKELLTGRLKCINVKQEGDISTGLQIKSFGSGTSRETITYEILPRTIVA